MQNSPECAQSLTICTPDSRLSSSAGESPRPTSDCKAFYRCTRWQTTGLQHNFSTCTHRDSCLVGCLQLYVTQLSCHADVCQTKLVRKRNHMHTRRADSMQADPRADLASSTCTCNDEKHAFNWRRESCTFLKPLFDLVYKLMLIS